jgi:hypothetical protein
MRNGSCPRSATSRHNSVRVGICWRPPDGATMADRFTVCNQITGVSTTAG